MAVMLDTPWTGSTYAPPTALDIATIETAILGQLGAQITTIEIGHYPDRPESYRLTHRIGAALVRYDGAAYGTLLDTAQVVQRRRLRFAIHLLMRDLGWSVGGEAGGPSPGAYALMEAIRGALTGFQIGGCSKMYPVRERFVERDKQGGVWVYESVFALTTMAVEASEADNFPLFVKGVAQEQGGQTVVSVAATQAIFSSAGIIQLANGNVSSVVAGSVPAGIIYTQSTDYTVDTVNGIVARLASGRIPAGAMVTITYSYAEVVIATASGGGSPTAPTN